jgi:small subunit ribosomal protein S7
MPRRRVAQRRDVLPDPVYNNPLVTKFINGVMLGGKVHCRGNLYKALTQIGEKAGDEPLKVFKRAIENVRPTVEVKSRRVGGSTYQVPLEVHQERRGALAIRWIVQYARGRGENQWLIALPENFSTPPTIAAMPSRKKKTRTAWPTPTKHSRIISGSKTDVRCWTLAGSKTNI